MCVACVTFSRYIRLARKTLFKFRLLTISSFFQQPKVIRNTTENFDRISFCLLFLDWIYPPSALYPISMYENLIAYEYYGPSFGAYETRKVYETV